MKKVFLVWLLIFALVVTACSGANNDEQQSTESDTQSNENAQSESDNQATDVNANAELEAAKVAEEEAKTAEAEAKAAEEQAKADAEKAAAEKAEAEKLLAEAKTAEEKKAAEALLAQKVAEEQTVMAALVKAENEKAAAAKIAAEKAAAAKIAAEKAAAAKIAAEKAAAEKAAAAKVATEKEKVTTPEKRKITELSLLLQSSGGEQTFKESWSHWKVIQEKTSTKLKVNPVVGAAFNTAANLDLASGFASDMLFSSTFAFLNELGNKGALVNLKDYLQYAPNLKKFLVENPEVAQRFSSFNGKLYAAPNKGFELTNRRSWGYREDIFRKNNLTAPKNLDELYTVLKKLKQIYPDSYPLGSLAGFSYMIGTYSAAFDSSRTAYYDKPQNKWVYGPTTDNFKNMVIFFRKLYNEKLISPDFLTNIPRATFNQALSTGKSMIYLDYFILDDLNTANRPLNPDFNLMYMPPVQTISTKPAFIPNLHFINSAYAITSESKNIKEAMEYIDWFYSPEAYLINSWGIEGDTYNIVNGEKVWNKVKYPATKDARVATGLATNGTYLLLDFDAHSTMFYPETQAGYKDIKKYDTYAQPTPAFNIVEQDFITVVGGAISKYMEESITAFILGNKPMEEWDSYKNQLKKLNVDELVKIHEAAHKRQLSSK